VKVRLRPPIVELSCPVKLIREFYSLGNVNVVHKYCPAFSLKFKHRVANVFFHTQLSAVKNLLVCVYIVVNSEIYGVLHFLIAVENHSFIKQSEFLQAPTLCLECFVLDYRLLLDD